MSEQVFVDAGVQPIFRSEELEDLIRDVVVDFGWRNLLNVIATIAEEQSVQLALVVGVDGRTVFVHGDGAGYVTLARAAAGRY